MEHIDKNTPAEKRKRRTPRRREAPPAEEVVAPPGPDAPHWIPTDYRWQKLPEPIRRAVPILAPAYRQFVLDVPGELERSVGLTLVHLTWLELCEQIQLAVAAADPDSLDAILKSPEDMLDRHLRLTTVKCQTAELLMKLQIVQHALQRPPVAPPPALPTLESTIAMFPRTAETTSFPHIAEAPTEPENGNPESC